MRSEEGKLYLFVAIDRTSRFAFAELHERATRPIAVESFAALSLRYPYKIHTTLTDNGIQFANRQKDLYAFKLLFDRICAQHGIDHRLTKPNHPWTNGQLERQLALREGQIEVLKKAIGIVSHDEQNGSR